MTTPVSCNYNLSALGRRHYVYRDDALIAVTASKRHATEIVDESVAHQLRANADFVRRGSDKFLAHADNVETTYTPMLYTESDKRYTEYTVTTATPALGALARAWFNRWF